jgi:hypothetical protein
MPLSDEQKKHVEEWLNSNLLLGRCPACGSTRWSVSEELVFAPTYTQTGELRLGSGLPLLPVICVICGCAMLFSAIKMGLDTATLAKQQKNERRPESAPGSDKPG